jgi:hypothetical protein
LKQKQTLMRSLCSRPHPSQAVHEIHTPPNQPFALCICRGHTSTKGELARLAGRAGGAPLGGLLGDEGEGGRAALRPRIFW